MSYLLECLGRGLLGQLLDAFENQLPTSADDEVDALERRRDHAPTSTDLAVRLGVACLRNLRLVEARGAFEAAADLSSNAKPAMLGLACVYDELGQNAQALRFLSIAQAHDPSDPAVVFGIGLVNERAGAMEAAEANYRRAIELCPQLRNAYERLAALAVQRGELDEAVARYRQLSEMEPGDLDILLTLGALSLQVGEPRHSIEHFQRALLIEPESSDGPLEAVHAAAGEGRVRQAIDTLREMVDKYPGVAEFHVHLGDLYVRAGDDDEAIKEYRAALATQPNFLEASVKLGTQHLRQGRFADAAQSFNRAVELNDRLMTAFVGLGVAQHAVGREKEADATFDLAATLEPNTTLLFCEAARLQIRSEVARDDEDEERIEAPARPRGEPSNEELLREALRRHRQALVNSPNYADLHYRYGLLLRQTEDFGGAIAAFRRAIEINPHYVKALIKLGICLKESGQTDSAIEAYQRALSLRQNYVDVHYQLGLLFAQRSRFDLAVEHFEHAVAGDGQNVAFRQNLALALQNLGMVDRASATWRSICELSRDATSLRPESRGVKLVDRNDD